MPNLNVGLENIGLWLQSRVAGFTLGQNLQIDHLLTSAPDRATALMNNSGFKVFHHQPRKQFDYMLQVYSRGKYWEHARDDNYEFFNYLYDPGEIEIFLPDVNPLFRIHTILVSTPPQEIPPDDKNRKIFSSNYKLTIFAL